MSDEDIETEEGQFRIEEDDGEKTLVVSDGSDEVRLPISDSDARDLADLVLEEGLYGVRWEGVKAVWEWYRVKEDWDRNPVPNSAQSLIVDTEHSSLLRWLLKGNEPFDVPPPVIMSRPAHEMVRQGEGKVYNFSDQFSLIENGLNVGGHPWVIQEKVGDSKWIASWTYTDLEGERHVHPSQWLIEPDPETEDSTFPLWKLTRVSDEDEEG